VNEEGRGKEALEKGRIPSLRMRDRILPKKKLKTVKKKDCCVGGGKKGGAVYIVQQYKNDITGKNKDKKRCSI